MKCFCFKRNKIIARIWHGRTKLENFEEYSEFLKKRAIPDYKGTEGFIKLTFLRKIKDGKGDFVLITFWKNLEVIRKFAREDYKRTKYYPKDKDYLLEFEENVTHYEVFAEK